MSHRSIIVRWAPIHGTTSCRIGEGTQKSDDTVNVVPSRYRFGKLADRHPQRNVPAPASAVLRGWVPFWTAVLGGGLRARPGALPVLPAES